ncbi:MAG: site-2 protease family protein [Acidobacteria bacterium]|nr:site-2 protease family protein [Acidobacteriota bacterium]
MLVHAWHAPAPRRRSAWEDWGRNLALFVLTAVSIFLTGAFRQTPQGVAFAPWDGVALSAALLAILLAHEMGHYVACRYYGVDATLPFFIPFPLLSLVGTLGAFIRIRSLIPNRRALFDIGIAGPLAGFVVCLPVLLLGALEGRWVPIVGTGEGPNYLGEPLLFQWAVQWLAGTPRDGMAFSLGPLGEAAWFGLFVTALNLIPVGQLDGGHVTYALSPRWALLVSRLGLGVCLVLLYFRPTWLIWSALLLLLGRRPHPPTVHDRPAVGVTRIGVGLAGLAVFAVSFTPSPIMITWGYVLQAFGLRP